MYINNLFRLKDWKIDEFLLLIIAAQTIFFLLIFLNYMGLDIPILKDVIGFFFVLFIPGTLLLRLINLDEIKSNGQILLYTIGSSLVILMLVGSLMNFLYPLIGIDKPLSSVSIIITFNVFVFVLCFLCYLVDKRRPDEKRFQPKKVELVKILQSPLLFPFIIPILSILGAYLMNVYQINGLTILMIFLIGLIAFMVSIGRFIPSKIYPLLIFCISISLLFHKSLITNYIWGWDINVEYYLAHIVILNSLWNVALPINYNSMLSVVVLVPILTSFINIGEVWIMKIIYPFLFSMVPLGLYYIFNKQTRPRIAFFSVFFFIIQFTYYTEMLTLLRQQVAELMLVLVLMLIVTHNLDVKKRFLLAVMFGMSIVVTHYGLTYLMMIILIMTAMFLYLLDKDLNKRLSDKIWPKIYRLTAVTTVITGHSQGIKKMAMSRKAKEPSIVEKIELYRTKSSDRIITSAFIILFIFFLFSWYSYTSSSTIFQSSVGIGQNIMQSLADMVDPNTASTSTQGLNLVMQQQLTPLRNIHKYFYLMSQFFILIGMLALFFKRDRMHFLKEYKALSLATFVILIFGLILPFFASTMNTTRLYHVALIIIAPFCILGIMKILDLFKLIRINLSNDYKYKFVAIFLIIFLLFDSGVVYQFLDNQDTTSIALSTSYDFPKLNQREVAAGNWLANVNYPNYTTYADAKRSPVLSSMLLSEEIPFYNDQITNTSYIFLGTYNLAKGKVYLTSMAGDNIEVAANYQSYLPTIISRSKIYDNGGSNIYGEINLGWL